MEYKGYIIEKIYCIKESYLSEKRHCKEGEWYFLAKVPLYEKIGVNFCEYFDYRILNLDTKLYIFSTRDFIKLKRHFITEAEWRDKQIKEILN